MWLLPETSIFYNIYFCGYCLAIMKHECSWFFWNILSSLIVLTNISFKLIALSSSF
ncbi:hypothetical protein ACE6H2_020323 [Prunus campanulata]